MRCQLCNMYLKKGNLAEHIECIKWRYEQVKDAGN